jgi:cytochrome c5
MKKAVQLVKSAIAMSGLTLAVVAASSASAEAPLTLAQVSDGFDAAATYARSCGACHNSGAAGAPRLSDTEEWAARLEEKGKDQLLTHLIEGYNNIMPAKGMCFTCTNEELAVVLDYVLTESGAQ